MPTDGRWDLNNAAVAGVSTRHLRLEVHFIGADAGQGVMSSSEQVYIVCYLALCLHVHSF